MPPVMPMTGAAKVEVPKNWPGMMFWIWGVPGIAVIVKVRMPTPIAAGMRRRGRSAARNSSLASGNITNTATNTEMPP